jgi:cysteine desulfurase / selenocysteine lyase
MVNWSRIREDFAIGQQNVLYLDNASVAPLPAPVAQASIEYLQRQANEGMAAYTYGLDIIVPETRARIADLIHAKASEIALVDNTGAGASIVANMLPWKAGDNVVISDLDFFPFQWTRLKKFGVELRIAQSLRADGTRDLSVDDLAALCDQNTRVIAISYVSFMNGLRFDLGALGQLARQVGAYLLVDAAQAVGAIPIDLNETPVDFLTGAGYKWLLGPLGTAFFYCREELIPQFEPAYVGWLGNKKRFNPNFCCDYELPETAERYMTGSLNIAGICGLNAGVKYIAEIGVENIYQRNRVLTDRFIAGAQEMGIRFMSPLREAARSQILGFIPHDLDKTVAALNRASIALPRRCEGIRFAPNFFNLEWEIDRLLEVLDTGSSKRIG